MIYLDNNATTPVDPAALEAMLPFLREQYANASSGYSFSRPVKKAVARAREQVAALAGCEPDEVVFTGGGTEADNAALLSAIHVFPDRKHLVVGATEHEAVLNCTAWLERERGYEVTRLGVDAQGRVDVAEIAAAIRPGQTAVVALMTANNETGVLAPVAEAAAIAAAHGVPFHTDAVQAAGKIPLNFRETGAHTMALSGHKFHAPKGVGALVVKRDIPFQPSLHGGGQEGGRRSGTENVPGIVALGAAAELALANLEATAESTRRLRDFFETEALRRVPGARVNGAEAERVPNTCSLRIDGVEAQAIILLLDRQGVCVSSGSACSTGSLHPSHVLSAMGLTPSEARSTLRFSFSKFNTMEETQTALNALEAAVRKYRDTLAGGR